MNNPTKGCEIMAVIPARGGSKTLPRKNVLPLQDRPLIAHIIETALATSKIDRVIVSTEDDEIARIATQYGAEVPFERPRELARDETPWVPVLQHALQTMSEEHNYDADAVVTLQPTTPFLTAAWIDRCVEAYLQTGADSVVSVCEDTRNYKEWSRDNNGRFTPLFDLDRKNRQWVSKRYRENGYVHISSRQVLLDLGLLAGENTHVVVMDDGFVDIDIHDETDMVVAEALLRRYGGAP